MTRKVFVSYKYGDRGVQSIMRLGDSSPTTARHYVNVLQNHLDENDCINKGEDDGESLAGFKDETIESRLRDKIFDSTVTVVLISKNMRDSVLAECDQWIPWEISYSLKAMTRNGRTSHTNGMLAVVLPDESGKYEYFVEHIGCPNCGGISWKHDLLFKILGKNMFNRKEPDTMICDHGGDEVLHIGEYHSYIYPVKWEDFISNINYYLDHAMLINENIDDYDLIKIP